jgi:hypothetical protein
MPGAEPLELFFIWNELIEENAGALGSKWLPSHRSIDSADSAIASTVESLSAELLT